LANRDPIGVRILALVWSLTLQNEVWCRFTLKTPVEEYPEIPRRSSILLRAWFLLDYGKEVTPRRSVI
jgi:hypothetical protein